MSTTRDWVGERKRGQEGASQASPRPHARSVSPEEPAHSVAWSPPVDIHETDERIVLRADLPGVSIEQIELRIESDRILLKGERSAESAGLRGDFHRIERPQGRFSRSFALPKSILQSEIRAVMDKGVLEVTLPKHSETRSKSIKVEQR